MRCIFSNIHRERINVLYMTENQARSQYFPQFRDLLQRNKYLKYIRNSWKPCVQQAFYDTGSKLLFNSSLTLFSSQEYFLSALYELLSTLPITPVVPKFQVPIALLFSLWSICRSAICNQQFPAPVLGNICPKNRKKNTIVAKHRASLYIVEGHF